MSGDSKIGEGCSSSPPRKAEENSLQRNSLHPALQCRRPGFNPWVGKIPWRRERLPTPVFWPGEFHGLYSSVQSLSLVRFFAIPWTAAPQASLSITNSQSLLKLMSIESVMPSNHFIPFRPLLLPSIFPTIRVVSNDSVLHIGWPKYWSLSFSISPSNEYLGLISLTIDWFDLLAVQGTLKSLSSTRVQEYHFFRAQPSLWSNSHICT